MDRQSRSVLVLGAGGRLGRAVVEAFAEAGFRVLAQMRKAPTYALPPATERLAIELECVHELAEHAAGVCAVVYAINPLYTEWQAHAEAMLQLGLDIAERTAALFLFPGNIYNFGAGMPAQLTEDTPEIPTTEKGRIRCAMEARIRERASRGVRSRIIRAGDFFGKGRGTWFDLAIVKSIQRGTLLYPGPLDVRHAWAYLPDLARAFVAIAEHDQNVSHRTYHFAGHNLTGAELLDAIEQAAHRLTSLPRNAYRRNNLPWWLFRCGSLFVPMWREILTMAYLWQVPHGIESQRIEQAVGPLTITPLSIALERTLIELGHGSSDISKSSPTSVSAAPAAREFS